MRSRSLLLWIVIGIAPWVAACDGGDDEDEVVLVLTNGTVAIADVAGTWDATQAVFGRFAAGPVVEVDVVEIGGAARLTLQADGRFSIALTEPGGATETSTGRMGFNDDFGAALLISFDDDPDAFGFFAIEHTEPTLAIVGGPVFEAYDFDGDGVEEDAEIDFRFVRR